VQTQNLDPPDPRQTDGNEGIVKLSPRNYSMRGLLASGSVNNRIQAHAGKRRTLSQ